MRNDIRAKMDNWAFQTKALMDELRNDASNDAAFCARQLSSAYENVNMQFGNQWGVKLRPIELPAVVIVEDDVPTVSDSGGEVTPIVESVAVETKTAKKAK